MKPSNDMHMQSLLAAARADAPSRSARDAMWKEVELGLSLVPAAASSGVRVTDSTPPPAPPAGAPAPPINLPPAPPPTSIALKAGLIGGGVGSGVTAVAVLLAMNVGLARPGATDGIVALERSNEVSLSDRDRAPSALVPFVGPAAERAIDGRTLARPSSSAMLGDADLLGREVSLVLSARESLLGSDPTRALDLARRARALHGQLDKEALTLEVRALRALGRDAEADRMEFELRVRHPSR